MVPGGGSDVDTFFMLGAQVSMRVDVVHVQTRLGGPILASFLAQPFVAVVAVVDMRRTIAV